MFVPTLKRHFIHSMCCHALLMVNVNLLIWWKVRWSTSFLWLWYRLSHALFVWFHIRKWREHQAVVILLYDGVCLLYEAKRQPYAVNINSYIVFTDVKGKSQLNQAQQSLKMNVSYIIQDLWIISLCKFWFTVISLTSSVSNRLFTVTEMTPPFELIYWISYSLCSLNPCSCYSNCK